MSSIIVADASCLIGLDNIGRLELLSQIYAHVLIPPAVEFEFGRHIAFTEVRTPTDLNLVRSLRVTLGLGESEAIALALEEGCSVILDDRKARITAEGVGLVTIGSVGVLIKAKQQKIIPSVGAILDELARVKFFVSATVRQEALKLAGEL